MMEKYNLNYLDELNDYYREYKDKQYIGDYGSIKIKNTIYLFTNHHIELKTLVFVECYDHFPYMMRILDISLKYNHINEVFKFIKKYGDWNCFPPEIKKFTNIKEIIGNDIIYRRFFDSENNLKEYCFSKKKIFDWNFFFNGNQNYDKR